MRNPRPMSAQRMAWPARPINNSARYMRGPGPMASFGQQAAPTANRGLLTKLFSRQATAPEAASASMFARSGGSAQTSLLQGLTNPQTIGNFLGKTQNVLNTAQQIGPLIQQYGPMVKNLPAMWRIYQGLTSTNNTENTESVNKSETEQEENNLDIESKTTDEPQNISADQIDHSSPKTKKQDTGKSVPKLYVPS